MTTATPVTVALALPYRAGSIPTLHTPPTTHWRAAVGAVARGLVSHPARWLMLAIGAVTAVSSLATVASPYLAGRAPLLLMCLSPRMAFLGIAAQDTPVMTFVLLGTMRLGLTDPLHYVIGRRLGPRRPPSISSRDPLLRLRCTLRGAAARVPRPVRLAVRPACCLAVLCRPNGVNLLWAGSQRIPAPLVAVLDLVGTTTYLLAMHAGANALGG